MPELLCPFCDGPADEDGCFDRECAASGLWMPLPPPADDDLRAIVAKYGITIQGLTHWGGRPIVDTEPL